MADNSEGTGTVETTAIVHVENGTPTAALVDLAPGEALVGEVLEPVADEGPAVEVAVAEIEAATERHVSDNEAAVAIAAIEAESERTDEWREAVSVLTNQLETLAMRVEQLSVPAPQLIPTPPPEILETVEVPQAEPEATDLIPQSTSDATSETLMEHIQESVADALEAVPAAPARRRRRLI